MPQVMSYCYECEELCYGLPSNNGVYSKDLAASNHYGHTAHNFRDPDDYAPPVRLVLIKLGADVPISNVEMQLFKIGVHTDPKVAPNIGAKWTAEQTHQWRDDWVAQRTERPMHQIKLTGQTPHPRFPKATTRLVWVYSDTGERVPPPEPMIDFDPPQPKPESVIVSEAEPATLF